MKVLAATFKEALPKRRFLTTWESVFVRNVLSVLLIFVNLGLIFESRTRGSSERNSSLFQHKGLKNKEGLGSLENYA